jgi:DNA-binding NarL/FixJ family response regulator
MREPLNPLSRTEITILRLVALGWNATAIGQYMKISRRTVHFYFGEIKKKFNARTIEQVMFIVGRDELLGEYLPGEEI